MDQLSVTTHGIAAETDYSRQTNITNIGLRSVLADLYLVFNTSFCVIICDFCYYRAIFFLFCYHLDNYNRPSIAIAVLKCQFNGISNSLTILASTCSKSRELRLIGNSCLRAISI